MNEMREDEPNKPRNKAGGDEVVKSRSMSITDLIKGNCPEDCDWLSWAFLDEAEQKITKGVV